MNEIGFETFDECYREATKLIDLKFLEATASVERELAIEDRGWILLSGVGGEIAPQKRVSLVKLCRLYYNFDPLAAQAIRLWTDYAFGPGMTWEVDDKKEPAKKQTKRVLEDFFYSRDNQPIFGSRGQRRLSDKLLVDGELFFAIFLGKESRIRTIDPLEITEIITDPDDIEAPMFYKRMWSDRQGKSHTDFYRSHQNIKNKSAKDAMGKSVQQTQDAIVYFMPFRNLGQRGSGLLVPGLDYLKYGKKFVAARVAMMLARTRWAEKLTVKGGQAAVDSVKAVFQDQTPQAASTRIENESVTSEVIQPPQDARNAYDDNRMLVLRFCAAVGLFEQYMGDISTGNLATAKTVELPMLKQFQSYQSVWSDAYQDIFDLVLEYNHVPEDNWYVDKDFPAIAPEDVFAAAQAIVQMVTAFPEFASAPEVQQQALVTLGINDPAQVLDALAKEAKSDPIIPLKKALVEFRRFLEAKKPTQ